MDIYKNRAFGINTRRASAFKDHGTGKSWMDDLPWRQLGFKYNLVTAFCVSRTRESSPILHRRLDNIIIDHVFVRISCLLCVSVTDIKWPTDDEQ